jgi:phosphomannomutase
MGEKYGHKTITLPIGFKHVAEYFVNDDVIVGGEESGGIAVKGHIPERDGIYIGLLITEMVVKSGRSLSQLVQDLFDEFGMHATYRNDLHTEESKKQAMMMAAKAKKITEIAGKKVVEWDMLDGVKHILEDGSWLMVRPSGTEPLLRIYSEAGSAEEAVKLVETASAMVDHPPA